MDLADLLERIDDAFGDERAPGRHSSRGYSRAVPRLRPGHALVVEGIAAVPTSVKALAAARHLARGLLVERGVHESSIREWAWIWSELGLADLVSDRLAYGWRVERDDGCQQSMSQTLLHVMKLDRRGRQRPGRALCGRLRNDSSPFYTSAVAPALRGSGEGPHVCRTCAERARGSDRTALDERLDIVWLPTADQDQLLERALDHATPALARAGSAQDRLTFSPDHERAVAEAVAQALSDGMRMAFAERTIAEYDVRGDEVLHSVMPEAEVDALRAWPHQSATRLVDLLTIDDVFSSSLPHLRRNPYMPERRLSRYEFSTPMGETIAKRVRARATEESDRIVKAFAARQAADERALRDAERATARQRILASYEGELARARPFERDGNLAETLHRSRPAGDGPSGEPAPDDHPDRPSGDEPDGIDAIIHRPRPPGD